MERDEMVPSTPTVSDAPAPEETREARASFGELSHPARTGEASSGEDKAAAVRGRPWLVMQRVDDPDPVRASVQAGEDLRNGANGLSIVFAGAPNAFGFGIPSSADGLRAALRDLPLREVNLRIDVHPQSRASIDWLAKILQEEQVDPSGVHLSFGVDPASLFVGTGQLRMSLEALEASLPQSLGGFFALSLPGVLLESDSRVYHNAGASEAQELGITLASVASHLKMFEDARQPVVYGLPHLGFAVSVDQNILASVAKLRALRRLWADLLAEYGVEPTPIPIHAETSFRMLSARDPQTNIIRNTMAAFAAAAGGATSITVLPHTLAVGLPDAAARRTALNTSLVQSIEVAAQDLVSASSETLSTLVDEFCEGAREEFRRIEADGGILRSIHSGSLQKRIAEARQQQIERRSAIVGSTVHAAAQAALSDALPEIRAQIAPDAAVTCEPLLPQLLESLAAGSPAA
jgi:methylmalonyl-CoA mutase